MHPDAAVAPPSTRSRMSLCFAWLALGATSPAPPGRERASTLTVWAPREAWRSEPTDRLIGAPERVREVAEVDEGGQIPVPVRQLGGRRRIPDHRHLEASVQQSAEMRLQAEVGRHTGHDHLVYPVGTQAPLQLVAARPVLPVRGCDDGPAVEEIRPVLRQEVRARASRPLRHEGPDL